MKTELNIKTRESFCHLVRYGFKTKELQQLSGYSRAWTMFRILCCKIFDRTCV